MVIDLALLRLLQLVSPGLPIGMYSYSQGMESAMADGWLTSSEEVKAWLHGIMNNTFAYVDLPILARLYEAWQSGDEAALAYWRVCLPAYRETAELRLEDRQCGQALARLLVSLGFTEIQSWSRDPDATLAAVFAFAAVRWGVAKKHTLMGYLWSWLENQVLCAVKLVPLGQVAGQKLLLNLADDIPALVERGLNLTDDDIGGSAFSLALASSRHEMQYSRLFRS
jgi:urease accessory protein